MLVSYITALILFITTVSLYFKFHIRQIIRELYGKEKRERVRQYEGNVLLVHSAVFNTKDPNGSMNALMRAYFKEEEKQEKNEKEKQTYPEQKALHVKREPISEPLPITEVLSSDTERLVKNDENIEEEVSEGMTEVLVHEEIPFTFKIRKEILRIYTREDIK